jgi:hypothetical protein
MVLQIYIPLLSLTQQVLGSPVSVYNPRKSCYLEEHGVFFVPEAELLECCTKHSIQWHCQELANAARWCCSFALADIKLARAAEPTMQ